MPLACRPLLAGESETCGALVRRAREQEQLFRGVLRQLGWTVPSRK